MGSAMFQSTCPVSNCRITNDRSELGSIAEFDAVLFHYRGAIQKKDFDRVMARDPRHNSKVGCLGMS